jgi:hypothetical protein
MRRVILPVEHNKIDIIDYGTSLSFEDIFKEAGNLDKICTSTDVPRVSAVDEIAGQYHESRIADKVEGTAPITETRHRMERRDSTAARFILGRQMPSKMTELDSHDLSMR